MGAASEPATTALAFNLERAGADVNGCVWIQMATGCDPVNEFPVVEKVGEVTD